MKNFIAVNKFFYMYLKRYGWMLFWMAVLAIATTYFQVVSPIYMGKVVGDLGHYLSLKLNPATAQAANLDAFYNSLIMFIIYISLSMVTLYLASILQSIVSPKSVQDMRQDLFAKIHRISIRYLDNNKDGELLSHFTSDLDNIFNAMNQAIFQLFSQGMLYIGVVWIMFATNVKLALITLATTPIIILVAAFLMKQAKANIDSQQAEIGHLNGFINEQITGQRVLITNGLQQKSINRFKIHNDKVKTATFKGQAWSNIIFPVMMGFNYLNLAIIICFGSQLVISGAVSKATGLALIVSFVELSQIYFSPIIQVTSTYNMLQLAITGAGRIIKSMAAEEETNTGVQRFPRFEKEITFNHVNFGYNQDKQILHDVDFKVKKGQTVAIVGPTGSGKSTMMNLLNRFYSLEDGQILIDETNINDIDLNELRNHVGLVHQDSILFSGTIKENIAFGKQNASFEEIVEVAKQANVHDYISQLPDGYDTYIDDHRSALSTGQKQLISIARTLLTDPDILVLDEATSNVDTVTEEKIQSAMDLAMQGRTSFVIAHRLKTVLNADKIIVLVNGKIIESGTHEELCALEGFYYKLYTNQMALD